MTASLLLYGIESAEAIGAPEISAPLSLAGIASAETFGTLRLCDLILRGIASAQWFGIPTLASSGADPSSYASTYQRQSLSAALLSVGVRATATPGSGTGAGGGSSGRGVVTVPAVSIVPTGAVNSSNKTYTIPSGYTILILFIDTQQVEPTTDYDYDGTTHTITVASARAAPSLSIRALCSYTAVS